MSFIITGDTHGTIDIGKVIKFFEGRDDEYSYNDYLIILGDVGVCGFSKEDEMKTRSILNNLPVTVLFIDGNHEHFDNLESYEVDIWKGGKVHFIEDHIIHLMRGQVFTINERKFFTFGGGYSIDKYLRIEGASWFPQEIPNHGEYEEGLKNLELANHKVDYILSHTCPMHVFNEMGYDDIGGMEMRLREYLEQVAEETEFSEWYFGHFHEDLTIFDRYYCLYNAIVVIE